ncbi:aminoacyl-tRNA hydrolase [Candidatus Microgenomates bacterium]|nr:aminoacyl-tRNA hydrolase [Candidatus Microgenomates bacterium]
MTSPDIEKPDTSLSWENFIKELRFETDRASGHGGQNVNKTETAVRARFSITETGLLTAAQKLFLIEKGVVGKSGDIAVRNADSASQKTNKDKSAEILYAKLVKWLTPKKERKKTKSPQWANEERLQTKKKLSDKKRFRLDKENY